MNPIQVPADGGTKINILGIPMVIRFPVVTPAAS